MLNRQRNESHLQWQQVCGFFDPFCSSVALLHGSCGKIPLAEQQVVCGWVGAQQQRVGPEDGSELPAALDAAGEVTLLCQLLTHCNNSADVPAPQMYQYQLHFKDMEAGTSSFLYPSYMNVWS